MPPSARPTSESAVAMIPRRKPASAVTVTTATMIQSRRVMARSSSPNAAALHLRGADDVAAGGHRPPDVIEVDDLATAVFRADQRQRQRAVAHTGGVLRTAADVHHPLG